MLLHHLLLIKILVLKVDHRSLILLLNGSTASHWLVRTTKLLEILIHLLETCPWNRPYLVQQRITGLSLLRLWRLLWEHNLEGLVGGCIKWELVSALTLNLLEHAWLAALNPIDSIAVVWWPSKIKVKIVFWNLQFLIAIARNYLVCWVLIHWTIPSLNRCGRCFINNVGISALIMFTEVASRMETHNSLLEGFVASWVNLALVTGFSLCNWGTLRVIFTYYQILKHFVPLRRFLSCIPSLQHFSTPWNNSVMLKALAYNLTLLVLSTTIDKVSNKDTLLLNLILSLHQFERSFEPIFILVVVWLLIWLLYHHLAASLLNKSRSWTLVGLRLMHTNIKLLQFVWIGAWFKRLLLQNSWDLFLSLPFRALTFADLHTNLVRNLKLLISLHIHSQWL